MLSKSYDLKKCNFGSKSLGNMRKNHRNLSKKTYDFKIKILKFIHKKKNDSVYIKM